MSNNQNPGYGQNNPQPPNYPQGGYPPQEQRPGYPQQGQHPGYPTAGQQPTYEPQGQYPNYPPRSYPQQGGYLPQEPRGYGGYPQGPYPIPPQKRRSVANIGFIIGGAIIAVLVLAIIATMLVRGHNGIKPATPPEPTQTTRAPEPTATAEPGPKPTSKPPKKETPSGDTINLTPGDISLGVPSGWTISGQENNSALMKNSKCALSVSSTQVDNGVSATSLVQQLGDSFSSDLEDFQWGYGPEAIDGVAGGSGAEGGVTGKYVSSSGSSPMYLGFAVLVRDSDSVAYAQQLWATSVDDYTACAKSAAVGVLNDAAKSMFG